MLEDYRAGLTVDRAAEEADRAAGRLGRRTTDLRGGGRIDSGQHMSEEAPDALVSALTPFLAM
jgi:haloacetate dehalogenase